LRLKTDIIITVRVTVYQALRKLKLKYGNRRFAISGRPITTDWENE